MKGLVLPALLTAVITASTVFMGNNMVGRASNKKKIDGVVAQSPEYLHPLRVSLLEEVHTRPLMGHETVSDTL